MPTQTTPGHWLTSVSSADRVGDRQAVDVEDQAAVVGDDAFPQRCARPPIAANRRVTCAAAIGITSTGSGKRPSRVDQLGAVGDADEALGEVGDDLLARQRRAAALDHAARAVDLVGAVDADRQRLDVAGVDDARCRARRSRAVLAALLDTAPAMRRSPSSRASASMKRLTVEPEPTPITAPGGT